MNSFKLEDYNFDLPQELIAKCPVVPRDSSKLLIYDNKNIEDAVFSSLADFIPANSVIILNDTKVMKARVLFEEGSKSVEVFFIDRLETGNFKVLVRPGVLFKVGSVLELPGGLEIEVVSILEDGTREIKVLSEEFVLVDYLNLYGNVPLPPYIDNPDPNSYEAQYQTVYANKYGSVAAPTAGLHFTPELISSLKKYGVEFLTVTLDVGIGTFMPVRVENIKEHIMHAEYFEVSKEVASKLNQFKSENRFLISVGSTSFRVLHSCYDFENGCFTPKVGTTDIFIYPGYSSFVVDAIITNFHLPKSTLFMMLSAIVGLDEAKRIYQHAIQKKYRFYSFGDASFIKIS